MRFHTHLLVNLGLAILAKLFLNIEDNLLAFFVIIGGVIDIDHILLSMIKHKTLSLKKVAQVERAAYKKMQSRLYLFHSPEFNILLIILSFFNIWCLVFLISNLIHISMDIFKHYKYHKNFKFIKEWSVVYPLSN